MNKDRAIKNVPWIISTVLLVTISACGAPLALPGTVSDYWETENNNSSSQADLMSLNYSPASGGYDYTGVIASNDTSEDWYRLTTTQPGQLSVALICDDLASSEEIYITLYDSWLSELDTATLSGTPGGSVTTRTAGGEPAGVFYIRIDADSWTHRYDLDPSFTSGGISLDYWEVESNDSSSQADLMSLNYRPGSDDYNYTGAITSDDTSEDWFRLTTTQPGQLSVALICEDLTFSEHIYITLYDSWLGRLDAATLSGTPGGSVRVRTASGEPAGVFYVRIDADSWTHQYDLDPGFTSGGSSSDYWEIENNDSSSQADGMLLSYSPVSDGYDYTGVIASDDSAGDWYRLTTTQSGRLSVTLICLDLAFSEHIYITLYDSWMGELDEATIGGTPGGSVTVRTASNEPAGIFYILIDADSWTHQYDLDPWFTP